MSETTPAAETAAQEETMLEKKTQRKIAKKKAPSSKAAKPAKSKKEKAPKKERPPKEDLCVFACRLTEAERVAFHKATGPAGASRFARKLMVAFANRDEAGFRALLKEAKEARG